MKLWPWSTIKRLREAHAQEQHSRLALEELARDLPPGEPHDCAWCRIYQALERSKAVSQEGSDE